LGVHIIREVMDEVLYEKRGAVGMRLSMVKRLRTDAAAAPTCGPGCVPGCGVSEGNQTNG